MRPTFQAIVLATLIVAPSLRDLDAQTRAPQPVERPRDGEVRIERLPQGVTVFVGRANRAVLGVTLSDDSRADSNGVKISEVRADSPAAKAGIKAGDIVTEVNGVSLRVGAVDAADPELDGIAQRRLQRALAKLKAGDEVDLRVQRGGASRSVKVKTVSQSELDGDRVRVAGQPNVMTDRDRAAIGVSVGASNNIRDTLGLFITSVVAEGPAERAGIVEGERIASVNGVDVRVPREEFEDRATAESRLNRFVREVQKGEIGGALTLRVYGGGRYRDVSVTTVRQSHLPIQEQTRMASGSFQFTIPRLQIHVDSDAMETGRESIRRAMDEVRRSMQELGRDFQFHFGDGQEIASPPRVRVSPRRTITIL